MTHADFEHSAVTDEARCGFLPMLAVMLGFTFFSASMVVGVKMANGLSFGRFAAANIGDRISGAATDWMI